MEIKILKVITLENETGICIAQCGNKLIIAIDSPVYEKRYEFELLK